MSHVIGKGNISAKIIADSVNPRGVRLTTFELEFPRFILPEFNTHRMFSRNSASSRAIPVKKMLEQIRAKPAMPIYWGSNQKGMQSGEETNSKILLHNNENDYVTREEAWSEAMHEAVDYSRWFADAGYHKQTTNRLTEPFQFMKVVLSATEWDNFYMLRDHEDAQPEIRELARCMRECHNQSEPVRLERGQWHLPYVRGNEELEALDIETQKKISVSCCAQVSYRTLNNSVDKALSIYERLAGSEPAHLSPFEHIAMVPKAKNHFSKKGFTHTTFDDNDFWSGNFREWIQYRQVI